MEPGDEQGKGRYSIVTRWIPGFYTTHDLPPGISGREALALARGHARRVHKQCCLRTPAGHNVWIKEQGQVWFISGGSRPSMTLRGKKVILGPDGFRPA